MRRYLYPAAVVLLAVSALWGADQQMRTLTVSGTAEVTVAPDICYMSFSIVTQNARSAKEAYRINKEATSKIQTALESAGIDKKDIRTADFSVTPQHHWSNWAKKSIVDGYDVSHSLTVAVRDLEKVSNVLDTVVNTGAAEVGYINFSIENPKKYTTAIRVEAIKAAQDKAETIAEATGVKLGKPISIVESEPREGSPYNGQFANTEVIQGNIDTEYGSAPQTSLEPGETKLNYTVRITYEIE